MGSCWHKPPVEPFEIYNYHTEATCIRCVDGDTLEIVFHYYGVPLKYRIRVAGVDCPESRTRDAQEKKHGLACKKAVEHLLLNQKIYVEVQGRNEAKYLPLAKVWYKGQALDEWLITNTPSIPYHGAKKIKNFEWHRGNDLYRQCLDEIS